LQVTPQSPQFEVLVSVLTQALPQTTSLGFGHWQLPLLQYSPATVLHALTQAPQ